MDSKTETHTHMTDSKRNTIIRAICEVNEHIALGGSTYDQRRAIYASHDVTTYDLDEYEYDQVGRCESREAASTTDWDFGLE